MAAGRGGAGASRVLAGGRAAAAVRRRGGHPAGDPRRDQRGPEERRAVRRIAANNDLRDVVGTWGLAQYLVVPVGLAASIGVLVRRPTLGAMAFAVACAGIGIACAVAMLYRGYFTLWVSP